MFLWHSLYSLRGTAVCVKLAGKTCSGDFDVTVFFGDVFSKQASYLYFLGQMLLQLENGVHDFPVSSIGISDLDAPLSTSSL